MRAETYSGALPAYDQPPVAEVALAIQFESDIGYRSVDLAAIASRWERTLPVVEEHPPLSPIAVDPGMQSVVFGLVEETVSPRLCLFNNERNRMLQIQQDRLVVNWRKHPEGSVYPSYANLRKSLVSAWAELSDAVRVLKLRPPVPSTCEVIYVNRIEYLNNRDVSRAMAKTIAPWSGMMSDDFLLVPREINSSFRFDLPESTGWLAIEVQSHQTGSNNGMVFLRLTSRGRATSPDLNGALAFMDLAHNWIVRGFTAMTTKQAHHEWGRTR